MDVTNSSTLNSLPIAERDGKDEKNDASINLNSQDIEDNDGALSRNAKKKKVTVNESAGANGIDEPGANAETSEGVLDNFVEATKNPNELRKIATAIDGKAPENRSTKEESAVDQAIKGTAEELEKKKVVSVEKNQRKRVKTKTGKEVDVQLALGEKSKIVRAEDNSEVLVLAEGLSRLEVLDETTKLISETLESESAEHGIKLRWDTPENLLRFTRRLSRRLYRRVVVRPTIIYSRVAETQSTSERLLDIKLDDQRREKSMIARARE